MEYIIANGEIIKRADFVPFEYNDPLVLTVKMWYGYGGIPLFKENLHILRQQLGFLNITTPELLNDEPEFFRLAKRMLNKCRYYRSGIITVLVFAETGKTETLVKCNAFEEFEFPVSKQGIFLNFSEVPVFSGSPVNRFAFYHRAVWKIAETENSSDPKKNTVFLNQQGNVTHCISANIFTVKGKELFTPGLETGCYTDSLRHLILEVSGKSGLKIRESLNLKKSDLLEMDEIFIVSEEKGIEWVLGIENKRFVHKLAALLHQKLNERLKEKVV